MRRQHSATDDLMPVSNPAVQHSSFDRDNWKWEKNLTAEVGRSSAPPGDTLSCNRNSRFENRKSKIREIDFRSPSSKGPLDSPATTQVWALIATMQNHASLRARDLSYPTPPPNLASSPIGDRHLPAYEKTLSIRSSFDQSA